MKIKLKGPALGSGPGPDVAVITRSNHTVRGPEPQSRRPNRSPFYAGARRGRRNRRENSQPRSARAVPKVGRQARQNRVDSRKPVRPAPLITYRKRRLSLAVLGTLRSAK